MKRPKLGSLVYVEMDDIEHESRGWQHHGAVKSTRPSTFRAVGWVYRSSKRTLTLASMASDNSAFCHYLIPWGSIKRWRKS